MSDWCRVEAWLGIRDVDEEMPRCFLLPSELRGDRSFVESIPPVCRRHVWDIRDLIKIEDQPGLLFSGSIVLLGAVNDNNCSWLSNAASKAKGHPRD